MLHGATVVAHGYEPLPSFFYKWLHPPLFVSSLPHLTLSPSASRSYMNAGTTTDTFLRENLEWLGRASNWAKFTATASIGVVHKGHIKESHNLLQVTHPSTHIHINRHSVSSTCEPSTHTLKKTHTYRYYPFLSHREIEWLG